MNIGLISIYVFENNGIRYLASSLRRQGHQVTEVYLNDYVHHNYIAPTETELNLLLEVLVKQDVKLVGISLRAGAYLILCTEITAKIKNRLNIPVIWGGPHVSMNPEQCFKLTDLLLLGEAEEAMCELAAAQENKNDISRISNVWFRDAGREIRNTLRPLRSNLDEIPFRDFHSGDFKYWIRGNRLHRGEPLLGERIYPMLTSRGCLYNCSYCDINAMRSLYDNDPGFFRFRSVENCLSEYKYAHQVFPKIKRIRFDDELFVPDKKWLEEFADRYPREVGLPFDILSDPRCLDEWTIGTLSHAGMDKVFVGIQASAGANRRLYDRQVSDDRVIEMAKDLKRHKVKGVFQIIVDDPEMTDADKEALLDLLLKLPKPFDLYVFSLSHWPGTKRTADLINKGLATTRQVEGENDKVLRQFMADFTYTRKAEDNFYLALYELTNKRLVPRSLVKRWSKSHRLRQNPGLLIFLARILNLGKLAYEGVGLLLRGELSMNMIRRWLTAVTSPSI